MFEYFEVIWQLSFLKRLYYALHDIHFWYKKYENNLELFVFN